MKRLTLPIIFFLTVYSLSPATIQGVGAFIPQIPNSGLAPGYNTVLVINATGEKMAMMGRVWFKERTGTKAVRKVGFRFGAVTKAGGSALTVSLQDVDLANGPPGQPDGTQDQTVSITNADAGFATNTWYSTGALSADRTVSFGDRLAVVIEYDGGGRLGADTVTVSGLTTAATVLNNLSTAASLFTSSAWAAQSSLIDLELEFSDGTFGTLQADAIISKALNTHTFNVDTAVSDEYALEFQFPFTCKIDGAWVGISAAAAGSDLEVIIYNGTTAQTNGTVTIDGNTLYAAATAKYLYITFPGEVAISANTTYRLAFRPTSTNNISIYSNDVNDANHFTTMGGGTTFAYSTRLDQGAWSATTTTRRLFAGVRISSISTTSCSGGASCAF